MAVQKAVLHWRTLAALGASLALVGPAVVIAKTPVSPDSSVSFPLLAALPDLPSEKLWVRLRHQSSLGDISRGLRLSPQKLAALNELETEHQFRSGDWLVIPSAKARDLQRVAEIGRAHV